MRRPIVFVLVGVIILVAVGVIWSSSRSVAITETGALADGLGATEAADSTRVAVEVEPVERRNIERYVTYYGMLTPRTTVQLSLQTGGRVQEVPVDVGDRVEIGDVLLRLDTAELSAQVRQAEAGLAQATAHLERLLSGATADELTQARAAVAQAEVQVDNARTEFERTERLFRSGSVSRQAFDAAESHLKLAQSQLDSAKARLAQVQRGAVPEEIAAAEAQVKQAQATLELMQVQLDRATLRSPVRGVISRRSIEAGEMAAPGVPLLTVVDLEELSLPLKAPGQDVVRIKTGAPAEVLIEDDPSLTTVGQIHRVDPVADPQSNLFTIELRLPNPDERLRAGFNASARIPVASAQNVLAVPEKAIDRKSVV